MIKTVHVSHIGRVRSVNEDSSWIRNLDTGYILGIVADGMGGHLAGDTASRLAVETLVQDLGTLEPGLSHASLSAALSDAILHANEVIFRTASSDDNYHNMGTTVVAALLNDTEGVIGHIGDSRAYKIANKHVIQLTEDHTLVNELFKNGQISKEDVSHHPRRNVLTRALGTDAEVKVDLDTVKLEEGEVLLLCSDGLSNLVSNEQIIQVAGNLELALEDRADRLLQLALLAGGDDNITVALFELQKEGSVISETGCES
ncbi:Stp1/IreP family PP2C-type Ser/Thr phosphatase [Paenibacillus taichungensis]|uniref:Stp1/IreP family PP2C-type Ser/Thr phosphatase n=1 Tax=Paenibacillus taichungensis TaxID=484184 RepID=A0ABX2MT37_9BACL|nr:MULTISPECIES: Stp1/IreP family PP2C-type Ser/Thr phosphatase [Paenibacillus]OME84824.1 serine/threonine protein phosphatase [Paenibacillus pabuli]MDR9747006.1 Stp1/IreP family PP2C-type Ser/Thr phosphatase [Paenibacillus taichungensis]MEC0108197.1 Stp1/IreP family PP2C-type Ser/Thr phosphatase [Paenibacillus taichungensis]MEC0199757.1 Stp1/IreP family PP2C-type Ser/Thr phosphatase [Paenibacillus taichungensis]NEU60559.1 Stp1/IreP family PP2C-type Ser/Thr phosphatase [Paenibacillus sp. ALJ10